jgi:NAD(P)-dependent dehydrogenase (short-subunit alcohol dehydrogenase family)
MVYNIAIIGGSGAIGSAFTKQLAKKHANAKIHSFSRSAVNFVNGNIINNIINYTDEGTIEEAALLASKLDPLDIVIVATGILCDDKIMPEKSLGELSTEKFLHLFKVNTILPALIMKHFLPAMNKRNRSVFATLSARVGSISDNRLGGWYAYRSSKSALNMIIKNAAIEIGRRNKKAIIVGLHPGTVDSKLSKPFQGNVPDDKLFSAEYSVKKLLEVIDKLTVESSGRCFSWDGKEVEP